MSDLLCFEAAIRYELGEAHEFDFVDGTIPCPPNPGEVYPTIDNHPRPFWIFNALLPLDALASNKP